MTHRLIFALVASVLLMSAAVAQEVSSDTAGMPEGLMEEAVEPELEIPETKDITAPLSVADYESGQTGGVVDTNPAVDHADADDLVPAHVLGSVPMDSDEVNLTQNIKPGDVMNEAGPVLEPAIASDAVSTVLEKAGVEIADE